MTGIELATHKIISGCGFLPESDQQGLFQTMKFLEQMFSPTAGKPRTPDQQTGLREIEEGFLMLFKHIATGVFSRDGISRKMALVWKAAEEMHPEFLAKFRK